MLRLIGGLLPGISMYNPLPLLWSSRVLPSVYIRMADDGIFSIVMRALESSVRGSTSAFLTFIGGSVLSAQVMLGMAWRGLVGEAD